MRKYLLVLLLIGIGMVLYSCGASPQPKSKEELATIAFGLAVDKLDTLFEDTQIVEDDINLPLNFTDINGVEIIWTSSERSIISDSGSFNRPNADIDVTLKATIIYGTFVHTKEYTVTAKALIDDNDDDDVEIPIVDYVTVFSIISEYGILEEQVDSNGNYQGDTFYGIEGIIVAVSGLNHAIMYSEGSFIQVEGFHGVFTVNIGEAYQISGLLIYHRHVPKFKVVNKLSTSTHLPTHQFVEPEYDEISLEVLEEANPAFILSFALAVTIEGYLNHGQMSDSNHSMTVDLSYTYDEEFEGRYVEIQSIIYFDALSREWIFDENSIYITEILAPCPVC